MAARPLDVDRPVTFDLEDARQVPEHTGALAAVQAAKRAADNFNWHVVHEQLDAAIKLLGAK